MSTDSHMDYEPNWDDRMVDMWDAAKNEYAVLSTYVANVDQLGLTTDHGGLDGKYEVPHLCMVMITSQVSERDPYAKEVISRTDPLPLNAEQAKALAVICARMDAAGIAWHEKTLGQLFCDGSAKQIVAMLTADLAQAVLLLAAEFYDQRHGGAEVQAGLPFAVQMLIERWRTVRVLGGGAV